jgi:CheY-specific phosphatase CheX
VAAYEPEDLGAEAGFCYASREFRDGHGNRGMRARFFGQYLVGNGRITAPQLLAAVEYQERNNTKLGSQAVALGLATPFEIERIRALQAKADLRFGEAGVRLGVLSDEDVQRVRAAQEGGHVQLGEALVALGYLRVDQVEAAAAEFLTAEARLEPDVVTIPADLPLREVAFELFHLAHKLLLRVCDLASKTERVHVMHGVLPLSDCNARVAVTGAFDTSVLFGLPHEIAFELASRFSGELEPADEDVDAIVCELANLLCGNLQSVLAEQGFRVEISAAQLLAARVSVPPGGRVALVPFVTHRGQVLVGLSLP